MLTKRCTSCRKTIHINATKCRYCLSEQPDDPGDLIISSSHNLEGYEIIEYIDYVCEDCSFISSFVEDIKADFKDLSTAWKANGVNLKGWEEPGSTNLIKRAREYVLDKFCQHVKDLGANAVIGFNVDAVWGDKLMRVSASGTAVYAIRRNGKEIFNAIKEANMQQVLQRQAEEEEKQNKLKRNKEFWEQNKERKAELDSKLEELAQKELEVNQNIEQNQARIDALKKRFENACSEKYAELDKQREEIRTLSNYRATLSAINVSERNRVTDQINSIQANLPDVNEINTERDALRREINVSIKTVEDQNQLVIAELEEIQSQIAEIQNELENACDQ